MHRRDFLACASLAAAGLTNRPGNACAGPDGSDTLASSTKAEGAKADSKDDLTLYLFVHAMPRTEQLVEKYMAKWEELFIEQGPKDNNVLCLLSNSAKDMPALTALGKRYFGERCIVDPSDDSDATKVLIANDLTRTLSVRGNKADWIVYEIWTSNNARRWSEGLKRSLDRLGYAEQRKHMNMVSCGQQWNGCLTKYSMFMAKYLELKTPPDKRADLSPSAGWPIEAEFAERISMDRNVYLFLFRTADGRPMAQYVDGMRAIWEPVNSAHVELDATKVLSITSTPNLYLRPQGAADVTGNTFIADVGDGCHPAATTLISNAMAYGDFRDSLAKAKIVPRKSSQTSLRPYENSVILGDAEGQGDNVGKNIPWL